MQTLSEMLRVYCFLVRVVCLLYVLLTVGYGITDITIVGISTGMTQQDGRISLMRTGLCMIIFYLPLCKFVKSLFPSLSSGKYHDYHKLVILIFYLFILAVSIPIINHKMKMPMGARESEGKQYISSMNRAQQAIFEEKSAFATSVDALGIGIKTETINFKYSVSITKQAVFHYGVSKQEKVRSHVGGVFVIGVNSNNTKDKITTKSILCRTEQLGTITPLPPTIQNDKLFCGNGTTEVTRL